MTVPPQSFRTSEVPERRFSLLEHFREDLAWLTHLQVIRRAQCQSLLKDHRERKLMEPYLANLDKTLAACQTLITGLEESLREQGYPIHKEPS